MNKLFKNTYFQIITGSVITFWIVSAVADNECPSAFSNSKQEHQNRKNGYTQFKTNSFDTDTMQKTVNENQVIQKYQEGLDQLSKDILDDTLVKLYERLILNDSTSITQKYPKMDYFVKDNKDIFDEMIQQIHEHLTQEKIASSHLVEKYQGKDGSNQFIKDYELYFNNIVDVLYDKLFHLEQIKNNPIQKYSDVADLIKSVKEHPLSWIPSPPENAIQKYQRENDYVQPTRNNTQSFGNSSIQKAFEKVLERQKKQQKTPDSPANYELVRIEDHDWLLNRNNKNKKEDIETVRTILAEKNKLNQLFQQRVGSAALEISAIWNQFHGSIDEFLTVRKESNFTKFRTEDKSPWQLIEESVGPNMTKTVVSLLYPVLSLQEISQIWMTQEQLDRQMTSSTSFLIKQKPKPPMFPIQPQVYNKITEDIQTINKESLDTTEKRRLMKKIIKIIQAMDPYPADKPSKLVNY